MKKFLTFFLISAITFSQQTFNTNEVYNPVTYIHNTLFSSNSKLSTSLSVDDIYEYQVFQRDKYNQADILISGTYDGTPTAIEASFNGSAYQIIAENPVDGNFSGVLQNQNAGQGVLFVRYVNDISITDNIDHIGIGDIFIIAGQSNASGRGITLNSYSHSTLKASLFGNDDVWKELKDPTDSSLNQVDGISSDAIAAGSPWPLIATSILETTGVPVAFVPTAKGGSGILSWSPQMINLDTSTLYGSMYRRIKAVGGSVAGVLFFQGESDS
jgi:hypothetical protein